MSARKDDQAAAMYAAYNSGLSLRGVGKKFGVTRQSVFSMLAARGYELRSRSMLPFVMYGGHKFTLDGNGYYRRTVGRAGEIHLHRIVWAEINGPVPPGCDIHHRDDDKRNNAPENLICLERAEHSREHNPLQPIPLKLCVACGAKLERKRKKKTRSGEWETPSAFAKRAACNLQCAGVARRGRPRAAAQMQHRKAA